MKTNRPQDIPRDHLALLIALIPLLLLGGLALVILNFAAQGAAR
jgi:hypothetical protein